MAGIAGELFLLSRCLGFDRSVGPPVVAVV